MNNKMVYFVAGLMLAFMLAIAFFSMVGDQLLWTKLLIYRPAIHI